MSKQDTWRKHIRTSLKTLHALAKVAHDIYELLSPLALLAALLATFPHLFH